MKKEVLREKPVPECRNASWFLTLLGTAFVNTVRPCTHYKVLGTMLPGKDEGSFFSLDGTPQVTG